MDFSNDPVVTPERPKSHLEEGAQWEPEAQGLAEYLGLSLVGSLPVARVVLALEWPVTPTPHPISGADRLTVCVSEYSPSQDEKEAGTRQPLVILLGWGGCTDKNLAKYSAIYHKRVSTAGMGTPRALGPCPM